MRPRIAVTMGDPAGIGPEICIKALGDPRVLAAADTLLVGSRAIVERCAASAGLRIPPGLSVEEVTVPDADAIQPGHVSAAGGRAAWSYLRRACDLARANAVRAIVTAPANKESLRAAGCPHIGHTELLAHEFGVADPLTMFMTGQLRVFFLTRHLSLREAVERVRRPTVLKMLRRVDGAMQTLCGRSPSIALAALNPHAGDGGQFGREEIEELAPAVADARAEGLRVEGPVPADSVFAQALEGAYDCVLSLYHDQGHIATKTRDFYGTVTATLGLPVLRTSVDHGTAFDIAWRGQAREESLVRAIEAAVELLQA